MTTETTDLEIKQTEAAKDVLGEILIKAYLTSDKIETSMVHDRDRSIVRLNIVSDEPQHIIGKQGENLFALQQLLRVVMRKRFGESPISLVVDVDNYRHQQEDNAMEMAKSAIRRLLASGQEQSLPPMPSYKRRAIHAFIVENPDYAKVATESTGLGPDRRVVLKLKKS